MENKEAGKPETSKLGRILREGTIMGENGFALKLSAQELVRDTLVIHTHPNGRGSYSYDVCDYATGTQGTPVHASPYIRGDEGLFVTLSREQLESGNLTVQVHVAEDGSRYFYEVYSDKTGLRADAIKPYAPHQMTGRQKVDSIFSEKPGSKFRAELR